jgi:hypothetical protein
MRRRQPSTFLARGGNRGAPVLPHLKLERRAGWVVVGPVGGKFHATVASSFLSVSEG